MDEWTKISLRSIVVTYTHIVFGLIVFPLLNNDTKVSSFVPTGTEKAMAWRFGLLAGR